jgi:lysophospholipase L1-like esterase
MEYIMKNNLVTILGGVSTGVLIFAVSLSGGRTESPSQAASSRAEGTASQPAKVFTIFTIGDSTMADRPVIPASPDRGWAQLLPLYFKEGVRIENHARSGRSSKSFRDQGLWQSVLDRLKPGDYVIIQFGHNDEKSSDPARYTEPFGAFRQNLERYVRDVREKGGLPILATPVVRRRFDAEGVFQDTHGDYPAAVRKVAEEQKAPLLDLHRRSAELVAKLGPELSKKIYLWTEPQEFAKHPKGTQDNTHFSVYGACRVCDLAVEEIAAAAPELAPRLNKK